MRYLALDIGHKYIGLAVSDPLGIIAQGLTTIQRDNPDKKNKTKEELINSSEIKNLEQIIQDYNVDVLVLGLAIKQDGTQGESARLAKELGNILKNDLGYKLVYQDERYSTKAANAVLLEADVSRKNRKRHIDKLAAVFILQTYLDSL